MLNLLLLLFKFHDRIGHIISIDDSVALEDAPSSPASDLHYHCFRNAGTSEIARRSSAKIVEDEPRVRPALAAAI